jgi:hypothetical protein
MVRRVAVKGAVEESGGGEGFDGFVTKVGGDGFLSSAVVAFLDREEKLHGTLVSVLFESGHRGAVTCHVSVAGELS